MRRQRNADATRKRRVNARRYVSRRKATSYHRGFSERTDGYFAFRVNSIVAKRGKKKKEKEKKRGGGGETRITKNNWRFDRKKYGQDAKQRVREMASSSLENSIFQDFSVIGRL